MIWGEHPMAFRQNNRAAANARRLRNIAWDCRVNCPKNIMSPFHSGMNHWQRQWLGDQLQKKHSPQPSMEAAPIVALVKLVWKQPSRKIRSNFNRSNPARL
jgi:hypothetical protein